MRKRYKKKTEIVNLAESRGENNKSEIDKDELLISVKKKAVGYTACECVEEYSMIEGELTLTKKKISYKDVAPDTAAIKLLLDNASVKEEVSLSELIAKRDELIKLFNEQQ